MPHENYAAKQQRIGERLTRAMAKAHMNRRELAELTGYSVAQIVSWERGRARLYPIELIKLCHALDVMPEWLLCWERRPSERLLKISQAHHREDLTHTLAESPSAMRGRVITARTAAEKLFDTLYDV